MNYAMYFYYYFAGAAAEEIPVSGSKRMLLLGVG